MTYKILSLDGGGVWALLQVKALMAIYGDPHKKGHDLLGGFDMAVATSGGAIVLGGLVENLSLAEILNLFLKDELRRSLFRPTKHLLDRIVAWAIGTGPRYDTQAKLRAVKRLFPANGGKTLPEAAEAVAGRASGRKPHLLITGFDYDRQLAAFFRSADAGKAGWGMGPATRNCTLAEAIHASSTPPVAFFDAPAAFGRGRYWDGGVAACNNPVLAGVAEARVLGVAPQDIAALSLGTGTKRLAGPPAERPGPLQMARTRQSLGADLGKLAGSITDDPPDVASFLAHVMTGGPDHAPPGTRSRIVRMSPMISPIAAPGGGWAPPGDFSLPDFQRMSNLELDALAAADIALIARFGDCWLQDEAMNQPIRMQSDELRPEIGQDRFGAALAAWRRLACGPSD